MHRVLSAIALWIRRTTVLATVAMAGILCVAIAQLATLPFPKAVDCAERGEGPFPFEKALCRQHVFWFRGSSADIATLQANQGAMNLLHAKSPKHTLAERWEMLTFLAQHGLDVNAKEDDAWTPLHAAIRDNNVEGVALLLRLHPSLNILAGPDNQTPLQLARELKRTDIVRRLLAEQKSQLQDKQDALAKEKQLESINAMDAEWATAQYWMLPPNQEHGDSAKD